MATPMPSRIVKRSAAALQGLIRGPAPRILKEGKLNLYETLSKLPGNGVGATVHQARWSTKDMADCYWKITECRTKNEGRNGKAWGTLVWKGKEISTTPERIRGALKYNWKQGPSQSTASSATIPPPAGKSSTSRHASP